MASSLRRISSRCSIQARAKFLQFSDAQLSQRIANCSFHSSVRARCGGQTTQDSSSLVTSAKVESIVEDICTLNLAEVAELSRVLKSRLNLPDSAMMAPMAMSAVPAGGAAPAAAESTPAEAEEESAPKQTIFDVVLKSFDDKQKVKLIKEVRAIFNLGIKEAKEVVDKAPVTLQKDCPKIDADQYIDKLKAVGAVIALE